MTIERQREVFMETLVFLLNNHYENGMSYYEKSWGFPDSGNDDDDSDNEGEE